MEHWWNDQVLQGKPGPQISQELTWEWTQACKNCLCYGMAMVCPSWEVLQKFIQKLRITHGAHHYIGSFLFSGINLLKMISQKTGTIRLNYFFTNLGICMSIKISKLIGIRIMPELGLQLLYKPNNLLQHEITSCDSICPFKLLWYANLLPHTSHANGRWPSWIAFKWTWNEKHYSTTITSFINTFCELTQSPFLHILQ
jgi:hypothetical protein